MKHAKVSYMLGNYLGTIALCGSVGEMIAILLFEIAIFKFTDKKGDRALLDEGKQKQIFGREFEKLGQERRIDVLRGYDVIGEEHVRLLAKVRDTRNKYLHYLSLDHSSVKQDALDIFKSTLDILLKVVGYTTADGGQLLPSPQIMTRYLTDRGIFRPEEISQEQTELSESQRRKENTSPDLSPQDNTKSNE